MVCMQDTIIAKKDYRDKMLYQRKKTIIFLHDDKTFYHLKGRSKNESIL